MNYFNRAIILVLLTLLSIPTFAQNLDKEFTIEQIIKFQAIPSDPVLDMLGIENGKIGKPGTIQKFLTNVVTASSPSGKLVNGIALSCSPYQLIKGESLSLLDYVQDYGKRILTNTMISFGTAPSLSDDGSLKWGIGTKIQFFNSGDGRVDMKSLNKIEETAREIFEKVGGMGFTNDQLQELKKYDEGSKSRNEKADQFIKENDDKVKNFLKNAGEIKTSDANWNTTYLDFNLGLIWSAENSQINKSSYERSRIWINGGFGTQSCKWFQAMYQAGLYIQKDSANTSTGAIMTRFGSETFRIGVGVSTEKKGKLDFSEITKGVIGLAGEIKISGSVWFVFSLDGNLEKNKTPSWNPSGGIKTSFGNFIY